MVVVSDPADGARASSPRRSDVAIAGASSTFLEPFVGPSSILVLDGAAHLRQRKLMLPPFHGERMRAHRDLIARARGGRGRALAARASRSRTHGRMQALTLDVIMRVVFGAELTRAARRDPPHARHDDVAAAAGRFSLVRGPAAPSAFLRALDARRRAALRERSARAGRRRAGTPILDALIAADGAADATSCATSSSRCSPPATRRRRARSPGRSSGSRATRGCSRGCARTSAATLDAVVKEVLRTRPVLSIAAAQARRAASRSAAGRCPPGVHVAPCIYLTHRRPELCPTRPRSAPSASSRRRAGAATRGSRSAAAPPLRRRGVRDDGDARGAARGRRARDARARPAGGRADAPRGRSR